MDLFVCWVCEQKTPLAFKNDHHKIPRAYGGSEEPSNFVRLCNGCHQSMHATATLLRNPKKAGSVFDSLMIYYKNDTKAVKRIVELSNLVNKYHLSVVEEENFDIDTKVRKTFWIDKKLSSSLHILARDCKKSENDLIEALIRNFVSKQGFK